MTHNSFDDRNYSLNLLDNLFLYGEFTRDLLIRTDAQFNHIDVILNLRELTKIQLNHLKNII